MTAKQVQFTFKSEVPMAEAQSTLLLAILAAEIVHGRERVDLESRHQVDIAARTIEIDLSSRVGDMIAMVFLGYARREFGYEAVTIKRIHANDAQQFTEGQS